MSLSDLQALEREAKHMENAWAALTSAAETLQRIRQGGKSLDDIVKAFQSQPHTYEIAKKEIFSVIDRQLVDLLRLAELQLTARAREHKISAAQRRAVLTACILPVPELNKGGAK